MADSDDDRTRMQLPEQEDVPGDDVTRVESRGRQADERPKPPRKLTDEQKAIVAEWHKKKAAETQQGKSLPTDDATVLKPGADAGTRTVFNQPTKIAADNASAETQFRLSTGATPAAAATPASGPRLQSRSDKSRPDQSRPEISWPREGRAATVQSPELGDQIVLKQRFVLGDVLGAGGMGVVYRATDLLKVEARDRDPYVAIKVLSEEFKTHPDAFIALQRESRKTQKIAHPNIVNVHDFDKDGDTVFMTMEFLDGSPLDDLILQYRATGLPQEDVWKIFEGICAAVAYAHEQGITHADLKPGNIFVTKQQTAKVFDFGIARAVAKAEQHEDDSENKTVFDVGTLGALTPAYASLEMLEGEDPDFRDDIYALGCIVYEMLTGNHPFNRVNAREAKRQGLKPSRIKSISKHQWQVIEQALEFERDNRIASATELWTRLNQKRSHKVKITVAAVALLMTAVSVWFYQFYEPPKPQLNEAEFRSKLEYKVRLEYLKKEISRLLTTPAFDGNWETSLWDNTQEITRLLGAGDAWVKASGKKAFTLYIGKIQNDIDAGQFDLARTHIENARHYTTDTTSLDDFSSEVDKAVKQQALAREEQQRQKQKAAQQQAQLAQKKQDEQQRRAQFDLALKNVNDQVSCVNQLDMHDMDIAINKLRSLDLSRYKRAEPNIVQQLAACITQIGRHFPERALASKKFALRTFNANATIKAIRVVPLDPCDLSLAGLGARGKRAICSDKLSVGGRGPALVVIPGKGRTNPFAIGKYEVSVSEINEYCRFSGSCSELKSAGDSMPVTDIPFSVAQGYTHWLSIKSGKRYRIPTLAEWRYAATANSGVLDANRNCKLDSRGIKKGGSLVSVTIGQQNAWGLVNYVGNAREWVLAKGGGLRTAGGSYETAMDECAIKTIGPSSGQPDKFSGFRVLRELSKSS